MLRMLNVTRPVQQFKLATVVGRRSLFITTEGPPSANPNMMKFILDRETMPEVYKNYLPSFKPDSRDLKFFPLPNALLNLGRKNALCSVFFLKNGISITKKATASWADLVPEIKQEIRTFYGQPKPITFEFREDYGEYGMRMDENGDFIFKSEPEPEEELTEDMGEGGEAMDDLEKLGIVWEIKPYSFLVR